MITTAQDWVLVRAPAPSSPTFGVPYRSSFHSLPAFLPPPELLGEMGLLGDVPPVTTDRISVRRVSGGDMEVALSRRAMQRRVRWAMMLAGFSLAVMAALVVIAFARG